MADDIMAELDMGRLLDAMVQKVCVAVCGYIGQTWGWKIVAKPRDKSTQERMQQEWSRLPTAAQDVLKDELKRSGYKTGRSDLLPLDWLTHRQREARQKSIVSVVMRAIAREDWLA